MKSDFFTRGSANKGVKLPLYYPDGTISKDHLTILGIDSDVFRSADASARRKAIDIAMIKDEAERDEALYQAKIVLISVLVSEWSFPEPCNAENVAEFLIEAPQLVDQIDEVAASRVEFVKKKQRRSTSTPKQKSPSIKGKKAAS